MSSASDYASVPAELKALPNWVGWKLETRADNKPTKVPYSATGVLASSTDRTTWRTFEEVKVIPSTGVMGIGFVFDGNGIVGIDLDHCLTDGVISDKFAYITDSLKTYTEISPSGTGLHLFIRCHEKPYDKGHKKDDVEIYSEGRYFTVTGNKWGDCPGHIVEYPPELVRELLDPFLSIPTPTTSRPLTTPDLHDGDIFDIISNSANADKFNRLMRGSIVEYDNDRSRADMALASILAFYTSDENQIERIMRQSGLVREKWDKHKLYLHEMTIRKAISMCTTHYEPTMAYDFDHGAEVSKALVSQKTSLVTTEDKKELTSKEIESIREAILMCENLPPFPEISHPLFKQWISIGKRLMYSHPSYHFGNLLPITSMALGRRVCVLISTKRAYTNFNMMLVGTSTISGKSFSSDTAIQEFGAHVVAIQAPVNPQDNSVLKRKSCSNPRLIQDLSDTYNMLWYYDEAKEFFDEAGERGWNAPIIGNLCTAYDGSPLEVARSNKRHHRDGEDEDDNMWRCPTPFLNLLFNMTITQLKEASTSKIVGSGFFYRWVWFIENGGEKKPNVTASDEDVRGIEEIRNEIIRVGLLMKQLQPDDIVFTVNKKIEDWSMEISKRSTDENYQAATGRSVMHVYKMAMLFSVFDKEFQKKIFNQPHYPIRLSLPDKWVDEAINIVENYLLPRMMLVVEYSEKVEQSNRQEWVLSKLKDSGGVVGHSELLKKTKLDTTEFTKAIRTLLESEEIKTTKSGSKTIYYISV